MVHQQPTSHNIMKTKTKTCSQCIIDKILDDFNNRASAPDGKRLECRDCQRLASKIYNANNKKALARRHREYRKTDKGKESHIKSNIKYRKTDKGKTATKRASKKYHETIVGDIRRKYHSMSQRCTDESHPGYERYGGKGITCDFVSSEHFVNYVMVELQEDPRGKETHRKDKDKSYCSGNIEFLTPKEHVNIHK